MRAVQSYTRISLLLSSFLACFVLFWFTWGRTAAVDWKDVHQEMDGFGASCADFYQDFTKEMADFFFTTSGIGLTLLRVQVVPNQHECESWFGRDGGTCVPRPEGSTILEGELAIAKQAVARGVVVWAAPWGPPGVMKTNGSFTNGGSLLPAHYADWAASLAGYVRFLESQGIPIYAISVQNEPDISQDYGSCVYTAQQLHDFIPFLYSALQSVGAGRTKIMIAEASQWVFDLTHTAMHDPFVAREVGILAAHGYGASKPFAPWSNGKHVWQTEDGGQSPRYDGSIQDGLLWAVKIHQYLTIANVNAWHWWFLSDGPKHGNGTDNAALTDFHMQYAKRAYVIGQWSKFVRPGWLRIGVSTVSSPLLLSAFKDPAGSSFAIVAVNSTKNDVAQTFSLDGFSASSITPWITSSTLSLAGRAPVSVSGARFSYTVPAMSVVTFSGTALTRPKSAQN